MKTSSLFIVLASFLFTIDLVALAQPQPQSQPQPPSQLQQQPQSQSGGASTSQASAAKSNASSGEGSLAPTTAAPTAAASGQAAAATSVSKQAGKLAGKWMDRAFISFPVTFVKGKDGAKIIYLLRTLEISNGVVSLSVRVFADPKTLLLTQVIKGNLKAEESSLNRHVMNLNIALTSNTVVAHKAGALLLPSTGLKACIQNFEVPVDMIKNGCSFFSSQKGKNALYTILYKQADGSILFGMNGLNFPANEEARTKILSISPMDLVSK